ncbi:hypothetical protein ACU0LD_006858, partial [Pseudomonas aeruginosa]
AQCLDRLTAFHCDLLRLSRLSQERSGLLLHFRTSNHSSRPTPQHQRPNYLFHSLFLLSQTPAVDRQA